MFMKVALITPPYPLEEVPSPPLGICYVAAACEAAGAEVRIFDYIVSQYTPDKLHRQMDEFQPDVVGATSVTMNFPVGAEILKAAKQHNPSVITVMGGPHVSFDAKNTLTRFPEIDAIIVGEGENTLMQWMPAAGSRSAWHGIKGLAFMDGGQFISTGPGEFIEDLDALPLPSRHLLPLSKYKALGFPISIITSRGCPNKCIFCLGRKMVGFKVRYRDTTRVVDEIESLVSKGFERINIADDLFVSNKKRVRRLCEEILNRRINFGWSAFARVDTVDEETLTLMRRAGCDAVSFGIESGNQEMLERVQKRITLDQARRAVRACKNAGMIAHASFMVGLPGESRETMQDSMEFARELAIEHGYHFLSPFPGTTVREHVADYDLEILTEDWARYDANTAIVRTSHLDPESMNAFVAEAYAPIFEKWNALKQKHADGKSTPDEALQVESEGRLRLIYDILSKDLVEKTGYYQTNGKEPIREFSARIAQETGISDEFVCRYMNLWVEKKFLGYAVQNGRVAWFWTSTNP
ncbi:MAG: B12-binding domain-containing radical SAM protein [Desulfobacterales bacterium CG23_combo_of_CG06-09_8_20_14_all_51_8]|nr:MAG: B12-binding domain-containing radical SAM protein [Desulfobacterales bacterium CG23_combo_of_CG06-09_8_20_14_all_51_8]